MTNPASGSWPTIADDVGEVARPVGAGVAAVDDDPAVQRAAGEVRDEPVEGAQQGGLAGAGRGRRPGTARPRGCSGRRRTAPGASASANVTPTCSKLDHAATSRPGRRAVGADGRPGRRQRGHRERRGHERGQQARPGCRRRQQRHRRHGGRAGEEESAAGCRCTSTNTASAATTPEPDDQPLRAAPTGRGGSGCGRAAPAEPQPGAADDQAAEQDRQSRARRRPCVEQAVDADADAEQPARRRSRPSCRRTAGDRWALRP